MILTPHIFHPASGACTFQECIFNKETFSIHPLKASESAEIISNISSIFSSNKAMTLPGTKYLKFFDYF